MGITKRQDGDIDYLELVLYDRASNAATAQTVSFDLVVPDLAIADVSVKYGKDTTFGIQGVHAATDAWTMYAYREDFGGELQQLHDIFEGSRSLPEEWRLEGPIRVRVTATISTGNYVRLLSYVRLSPAMPMCAEEWEKRRNAIKFVGVETNTQAPSL